MIGAFNLKLFSNDISKLSTIKDEKSKSNSRFEELVDKIIDSKGGIDGDLLSNLYFDFRNVDVFISYSHNDEKIAKALANFLEKYFGFEVFLDCEVWKSSNELLNKIDNKYCLLNDKKSFSYEKRNFSTSHVHSILSTAIIRQISESKFVFFLNTINSVKTIENVIKNKLQTNSPWIYEEIVFTDLLLKEREKGQKSASDDRILFEDTLSVRRTLPLDRFKNITLQDLLNLVTKKKYYNISGIKLFKELLKEN